MKVINRHYHGFVQVHFKNGDVEAYVIENSPWEVWGNEQYENLGRSFTMNFAFITMIMFFDNKLESKYLFRNNPGMQK